jgi:hypothetical protein
VVCFNHTTFQSSTTGRDFCELLAAGPVVPGVEHQLGVSILPVSFGPIVCIRELVLTSRNRCSRQEAVVFTGDTSDATCRRGA